MTVNIQTFPEAWYDLIVSNKFVLRSINQSAGRPWGGAGTAVSNRPHTQLWTEQITFGPLRDPILQDIDALIARAKGRSGLIRMSNVMRLLPWHDRDLIENNGYTTSTFSDGATFSDGSKFINGLLPPEIQVEESAVRGAGYLVLSGFPASMANVLRRGDLLQIKPGGVAGTVPHLYKATFGGDADSSGRIGIEIEPRLRQGVNASDTVSLRFPDTLFRFVDDNQGDIDGSPGKFGNLGFSLVEALDMVP